MNDSIDLDTFLAQELTEYEGSQKYAPVNSEMVRNMDFTNPQQAKPQQTQTQQTQTQIQTIALSSQASASSISTDCRNEEANTTQYTVWPKNFLPGKKKPTLEDAKARLNIGTSSLVRETNNENVEKMLQTLTERRNHIYEWAKGKVNVRMVKVAQFLGMKLGGKIMIRDKNDINKCFENSEEVRSKIWNIIYRALDDPGWTNTLEKKYMEENKIVYDENGKGGCIRSIINEAKNNMRRPIRNWGAKKMDY